MVLQRHLRDDLSRTGKTESARVERHVVEGRIVYLGIEVASHVAVPCLVFFPDKLGRFGFIQLVVFGGMPDTHRKRGYQPHVKHIREARGDDARAAPYQDGVAQASRTKDGFSRVLRQRPAGRM